MIWLISVFVGVIIIMEKVRMLTLWNPEPTSWGSFVWSWRAFSVYLDFPTVVQGHTACWTLLTGCNLNVFFT